MDAEDRTRIALLSLGRGSATPLPLRGDRTTSGADLREVRVHHWAGADVVAVLGPGGQKLELRPGALGATTPIPTGWRWADVRWYAWSEDGEPVGVPEVSTRSVCGAPVSAGADASWGYTASLQDLDQLLQATQGVELSSLLTDAAVDGHPVLRLRPMVPKAFTGRPGQARLRLDLAGGHTVGMLRLDPVVDAVDLTVVDPLSVTTWSFRVQTPTGPVSGVLETRPDQLVLRVSTSGGESAPNGAPLVLTLPAEIAP